MALALLTALGWTLRDIEWGTSWSRISAATPGWLFLATAVNLGVVGLQALRWLALVRPLAPRATFSDALQSLLICFAFSTVLPARAGEFVRVRTFSLRTGLPAASVVATIGLDYAVNAVTLVVGATVLLFFVEIPSWVRPGKIVPMVATAACFGLFLATRPAGTGVRTGPAGFLATAREGLNAACRPKALGASLLASFATWWVEIYMTQFAMRAVGIELSSSRICLVLLAVNLALAVPLQPPGNFGTIELGATLALVAMGVAKEQALAFGVVYHLIQVVPVGILGLLLWGRESLRLARA
jgi:uncharacterized membrane protein YbhN (UPF0104 family)